MNVEFQKALSNSRAGSVLVLPPLHRLITLLFLCICCLGLTPSRIEGKVPSSFDTLEAQYHQGIRPMLQEFCLGCHSTAARVSGLDLEQFKTFAEVRLG